MLFWGCRRSDQRLAQQRHMLLPVKLPGRHAAFHVAFYILDSRYMHFVSTLIPAASISIGASIDAGLVRPV